MIEAIQIGATGLHSQQQQVDVVSNNIANLNTPAFKKTRVDFGDLVYRANGPVGGYRDTATSIKGTGAAVIGEQKVFTVGEVRRTGQELDVAISGNGFFEVAMEDGTNAYTRNGSFVTDRNGVLRTRDGYPLVPLIQVPDDATSIKIDRNGVVTAFFSSADEPMELGQMELADFVNPSGLKADGAGLYRDTEASGLAIYGYAGDNGLGGIMQGYLEGSNVDLVEELTNLMTAQRGYELNARVVQAADEMLRIVNDLRR